MQITFIGTRKNADPTEREQQCGRRGTVGFDEPVDGIHAERTDIDQCEHRLARNEIRARFIRVARRDHVAGLVGERSIRAFERCAVAGQQHDLRL